MKKILFFLFILICSSQFALAQMPVTDIGMNTNTIANQITNAATWSSQLLKLKEQATVLTTTLKFVTDVSSAIRDVAYAKFLIERQAYIVKRCSYLLRHADGVDNQLYRGLESSISSILVNNNSLITLLNSALTSRFKMNDAERLGVLMNIKSEQTQLLENLRTTDIIISTSINTKEIINYQLLK